MKGGQIQGIKVAGMEVTVVTRQQAMCGRWTTSHCAARPVDLLGSCRTAAEGSWSTMLLMGRELELWPPLRGSTARHHRAAGLNANPR